MSYKTIINCKDLMLNIDNRDFVVFDCRCDIKNPNYGIETYTEGHIKNSIFVDINVDLEKKTTLLKLKISAKGDVMVNCDLTNEPFKLDVENCIDLVVKFGSEFNDEDDEILIVPHGEYKINVAQYIYELIVLSIPAKRIHPGVLDGSLKSEILNILEDLKPNEKKSKVDPRWEKLKELTNKKD